MALIMGTSSNDVLNASNPGDEVRGLDGNDSLTGLAGNERLLGGNGNDTLIGNAGDDQLDGGAGADSMNGGTGNDSYIVDNVGDTVTDPDKASIYTTVSFNLSNVSGRVTNSGLNLFLQASGITGTGSSENDLILSYASNTTLKGGAGSDILKGGSSSTVYGGSGDDVLEITNSGIGTLIGGAGNDVYNVYQVGNLVIDEQSDSGSGTDTVITTVDFSLTQNGVTFPVTGVTFKGADLIENLTLAVTSTGGAIKGEGNNLNNIIIGNRQDNILNGLNGNDTISGSYGNDSINGGAGNDRLYGDEGDDTLIGGGGIDTLVGGNGNDSYNIDASNTIIESSGAGTDTVNVSSGNGTWTTTAEVEYVNITGTNPINIKLNNTVGTTVNGNGVYNTLIGGAGNDILAGKAGIDMLTGGLGADGFEFGGTGLNSSGSTPTSIRQDTITDFNSSQGDKIRLSATTFTLLAGKVGLDLTSIANGFTFGSFGSNNKDIDKANGLFVYNTANGYLLYNTNLTSSGYGTGGDYFAILTGSPSLAATDFTIVA